MPEWGIRLREQLASAFGLAQLLALQPEWGIRLREQLASAFGLAQ